MISSISYGEPFNGQRPRNTLIGTVTLTEPTTRRIGYETASWYTEVEVPAGSYDIVVNEHSGFRCILVKYTGTVTDEHFVNRVFGSSSVAPKRNIGKASNAFAQHYCYIAAEHFANDPQWVLADDWSIQSEQREYSDGRPYTAYSLVGPDGEIRR